MAENKIKISPDVEKNKKIYHFMKRIFDIILSFCALVILSPVFLVIAIAIVIDSHSGSILYSQTRIGQNGHEFVMYKFRSMVLNADKMVDNLAKKNEVSGAMFKIKDDPRITRVGKFLRKHSLDELPQLWNVLKGDMSLVGPRPPLGREVVNYTNYDKQRLIAKPGCTGLWQVSGRNDVSFDEMVVLDLKYITESNLWLDFVILLRTVIVFLKPNGAY